MYFDFFYFIKKKKTKKKNSNETCITFVFKKLKIKNKKLNNYQIDHLTN